MKFTCDHLQNQIITLLFFFSFNHTVQAVEKPILQIGVLPSSLRLDGRLTEPVWSNVDSIVALTMIEPSEGAQPSNRTFVKVLANRSALVFGFRCLDNNSENIVAYAKIRDAELRKEDHIRFVLDTFMDERSGYIFAINPLPTAGSGIRIRY